MKYLDTAYTNGVIAVREKHLLKDKLFRLCELPVDDAFRTLLENGFGGGAETTSNVYEYEKLITAETARTDEFVREYSPSWIEKAYLLSPRDFHNAKALIKADYLGIDGGGMLASEGLVSIETLRACIEKRDFSALENKLLAQA